MQTIQLQLDDTLYEQLVMKNVDIQETVETYLSEYVEDDGYPAISLEEAQLRVAKAVEDYRQNGSEYFKVLDESFWASRVTSSAHRNREQRNRYKTSAVLTSV